LWLKEVIAIWLYRFEVNIRASAILGVLGGGGIGSHRHHAGGDCRGEFLVSVAGSREVARQPEPGNGGEL